MKVVAILALFSVLNCYFTSASPVSSPSNQLSPPKIQQLLDLKIRCQLAAKLFPLGFDPNDIEVVNFNLKNPGILEKTHIKGLKNPFVKTKKFDITHENNLNSIFWTEKSPDNVWLEYQEGNRKHFVFVNSTSSKILSTFLSDATIVLSSPYAYIYKCNTKFLLVLDLNSKSNHTQRLPKIPCNPTVHVDSNRITLADEKSCVTSDLKSSRKGKHWVIFKPCTDRFWMRLETTKKEGTTETGFVNLDYILTRTNCTIKFDPSFRKNTYVKYRYKPEKTTTTTARSTTSLATTQPNRFASFFEDNHTTRNDYLWMFGPALAVLGIGVIAAVAVVLFGRYCSKKFPASESIDDPLSSQSSDDETLDQMAVENADIPLDIDQQFKRIQVNEQKFSPILGNRLQVGPKEEQKTLKSLEISKNFELKSVGEEGEVNVSPKPIKELVETQNLEDKTRKNEKKIEENANENMKIPEIPKKIEENEEKMTKNDEKSPKIEENAIKKGEIEENSKENAEKNEQNEDSKQEQVEKRDEKDEKKSEEEKEAEKKDEQPKTAEEKQKEMEESDSYMKRWSNFVQNLGHWRKQLNEKMEKIPPSKKSPDGKKQDQMSSKMDELNSENSSAVSESQKSQSKSAGPISERRSTDAKKKWTDSNNKNKKDDYWNRRQTGQERF